MTSHPIPPLSNLLFGIWNAHFACDDKTNQIDAQNADGGVPPAGICNEEVVYFNRMHVDNFISEEYTLSPLQRLITILFLFMLPNVGQAQSCTGSLGDNIFVDGDFGNGSANILPNDPQIAPGYVYTTNPPPNDGFYTITNDMAKWANVYSVWHTPKDNSPRSDGYMMVVNASFTPGSFYRKKITGLCENTRYVFSADIINLDRASLQRRILPNVSFLINGVVTYSSGNIVNDEKWHNYAFVFSTENNQTELDLSLVNNAPGGLGNDLALDNISFRPCGPILYIFPETPANICEDGNPVPVKGFVNTEDGDAFVLMWQISYDEGQTWVDLPGSSSETYLHTIKTPGTYYYRFLSAGSFAGLSNPKCRVVSPIKIVNVIPKKYFYTDTICAGNFYMQAGKKYELPGIYTDSLQSVYGCDSIVTLDLHVATDATFNYTTTHSDPTCTYTSDGKFDVSLSHLTYPPATIKWFNSLGQAINGTSGLNAGTYYFDITDRLSCKIRDSVFLSLPEEFTVEMGPDRTIHLGDKLDLDLESNQFIEAVYWNGYDIQNCTSPPCNSFSFIPFESGVLWAKAENNRLCTALDSLRITVLNEPDFNFSNILSLNSPENQIFLLKGNVGAIAEILSLEIYDRWGNLVYQGRESYEKAEDAFFWDLSSRQPKLESGAYSYVLNLRLINQRAYTRRGSLTILK